MKCQQTTDHHITGTDILGEYVTQAALYLHGQIWYVQHVSKIAVMGIIVLYHNINCVCAGRLVGACIITV